MSAIKNGIQTALANQFGDSAVAGGGATHSQFSAQARELFNGLASPTPQVSLDNTLNVSGP